MVTALDAPSISFVDQPNLSELALACPTPFRSQDCTTDEVTALILVLQKMSCTILDVVSGHVPFILKWVCFSVYNTLHAP